ncbi:penicillin-binding transpeptidase domain-containing protein [Brevibacterium album]|uniref:penicillin-binding transpeptidase domain-containing protein n=1 Tax=Brevibacterium album TaxID=417948 RepID=UPI00040973A0|nr:penicillin-binding transpeptidase domain-containing protein [Brevibacterium album]
MPSPRRLSARTWTLIAAGAFVLVLLAVIGVFALRGGSSPEAVAERAVSGLRSGELEAAGWPAGADEEFAAITADLGALEGTGPFGAPEIELTGVSPEGDSAAAHLSWSWPHGDRSWDYTSSLPLTRTDGEWHPVLEPGAIHPELAAGGVLRTVTERAPRGRILGAGEEVLSGPREVVVVGVEPRRAEDAGELADDLAEHLDIDGSALAQRIDEAADDAFVEVITLRREDYDAVSDAIRLLPGTVFREEQQPLGRTREFAAATLGSAGPATAEDLEAADGRYSAGYVVGRSGLNRAFDEELRGASTVTVSRMDADEEHHELAVLAGADGADVTTTLDVGVQEAADAATAEADRPAALVAVRPSDGHVLAASNHDPDGGVFDRGLTGRYPPGSVFKIASSLALLRTGTAPDDVLACPQTTEVDGKVFTNAEDAELGAVTFAEDFAQSCNTAFVDAAAQVDGDALTAAAEDLGMASSAIGTDAFGASIPVESDPVAHAALMIGQGTAEASPLAGAVMAASVARGQRVDAVLVPEAQDGAGRNGDGEDRAGGNRPGGDEAGGDEAAQAEPGQPEPEHIAVLQELMAETVRTGTASALADAPRPAVHGKTGTAEYGGETPPRSHSWFTGYQGDLAFAVLVEDGGFGSEAAVPMAEEFLRTLRG